VKKGETMLVPNQEKLNNLLGSKATYKCTNCGKIFTEFKKIEMYKGITIAGITGPIPACPHCDYMFFFGLEPEENQNLKKIN
jgi:DNA-directed RNA polymerase subunit RPC12/RpoP